MSNDSDIGVYREIHSDQNEVATWRVLVVREKDGTWYSGRVMSTTKGPDFSYSVRAQDMERVWFQSRAVFLGFSAGTNDGSVGLSYSEVF